MSEKKKLVIFDRDGTLVDFHRDVELGVVTPAFHPGQVRLMPGAVEAIARLKRAGFLVAMASNQPGAAKGEITRAAIVQTTDAILQRFADGAAALDAVEVCLHHPTGGERGDATLVGPCRCRKPEPGMLLALAAKLSVDPADAWMVGDTSVDVLAGRAAKMHTALVSPTRRCELCPNKDAPPVGTPPDVHAPTLDEIVRAIESAP